MTNTIQILGSTQQSTEGHLWSWTYAHGELEEDLMFDMFLTDQPKPDVGKHLLTYKGRTVLCNIVDEQTQRNGVYSLACYVTDTESVRHILLE